jgi:hypothetical protein
VQSVFDFFLLDSNRLFAVPLIIIGVILFLEVAMMVLGASLHGMVDDVLHIDKPHFDKGEFSHNPGMNFFNWINAGNVPILLLVVSFLGVFGVSGLIIQWIAHGFNPSLLPNLIAGPLALLISLPIVRQMSKVIAAIVPKEHTTAVEVESLIGRHGLVVIGTSSIEHPGQAKVKDQFDTTHYVRIIPLEDNDSLLLGSNVVLVSREGPLFYARRS